MKRKRFSEEQIVGVLKEAEAGVPAAGLCRKYGISDATFYTWRKKYSGIQLNDLKRLRELESENSKLKRIVADLTLDNTVLRDVVKKKW